MLSFPPFRLDVAEERLWKDTKLVAVRRKPFAILRYLVGHPRRLVTHDELVKEVWGGNVVSESSVRTHLHDLRQVLGEGLIETVIGRGYRFTGDVARDEDVRVEPAPLVPQPIVIGRGAELERLHDALARASSGQRQIVLVTGEPGIGKTTLVDAFLDAIDEGVLALRSGCFEQHSAPEAYGPMIELFGQLRQDRRGEQALAMLVRHAPTFLALVPQLVPDAQRAEVDRRASGGSEAKVMREVVEALEAMSMHTPHVIVLEDLQWSDIATLDLLSLLAQRRERAKLLVIATSRRAEAATIEHPLNRIARTLVTRGGAIALPLERLASPAIAGFIEARFPAHAFPPAFAITIEAITGGTPLFLAAMLDDLVARGMLAIVDGSWRLTVELAAVAAHRPDNVKQLIDIHLDRLTPLEQRVLEAASAIGRLCQTALIARALEIPIEQADEVCDSLARRALFLRHEGTQDWPDGTQQSCYGFTHGLVQEVCAARNAPARRQRWSRLIAEGLEAAWGAQVDEVSTELALHYERAQVAARAVHFHVVVGDRMANRFAIVTALPSYERASTLLGRLPESRERDMLELRILGGMAPAALRVGNFDDETWLVRFQRMIELALRLGDHEACCNAMINLSVRYTAIGRYEQANGINADLVALANTSLDPIFLPAIAATRALTLFWQGRIRETIELLAPIAGRDSATERDQRLGILDPTGRKIALTSYLGTAYWLAGRPDDALAEIERAHQLAIAIQDPYIIGLTAISLARFRFLQREPVETIRGLAEAVSTQSDAQQWQAQARLLVTWARSTEAPLASAELDDMVNLYRERTASYPMGASYVALTVIDALRRSNALDRAVAVADAAIDTVHACGALAFEPELVRMRGELEADPAVAATYYRDALARARELGLHGIALRAAISLDDPDAIAQARAAGR